MNSRRINISNLLSENNGFTISELLIVTFIMGIIASLSVPSLTNFVHNEREKSYIKEVKNFIPTVIREARRWGGTCTIKPNLNWHPDLNPGGLEVDCKGIQGFGNTSKNTIKKGPNITKHIFQEMSGDLTITPKGQILITNSNTSSGNIVFVVGGRNDSGSRTPKCLYLAEPVGIPKAGNYTLTYNYTSGRRASVYNKSLNENNCLNP